MFPGRQKSTRTLRALWNHPRHWKEGNYSPKWRFGILGQATNLPWWCRVMQDARGPQAPVGGAQCSCGKSTVLLVGGAQLRHSYRRYKKDQPPHRIPHSNSITPTGSPIRPPASFLASRQDLSPFFRRFSSFAQYSRFLISFRRFCMLLEILKPVCVVFYDVWRCKTSRLFSTGRVRPRVVFVPARKKSNFARYLWFFIEHGSHKIKLRSIRVVFDRISLDTVNIASQKRRFY